MQKETTFYSLFASVVCGFCVLTFHYNYSVINIPEYFIRKCKDYQVEYKLGFSNCVQMTDSFWGYFASVVSIGAFFGCFISIYSSCRLGRLNTLLVQNVGFIVGGAMVSFSNNKFIMLAGRFVIGVSGGTAQPAAYLYAAEIATPKNRGSIGILVSVIGDSGKILALGLSIVLNGYYLWRILFSVVIGSSLLQLLALAFFTETPKFLVMYRNNVPKAQKALNRIRGHSFCQEELKTIQDQNIENIKIESSQTRAIGLLFSKTYRKRLFIVLAVLCGQGLGGPSALDYFSQSIIGQFFESKWASLYLLASDCLGIVASLLIMVYIDRLGRRLFLIGSQLGVAFSCLLLVVGSVLKQKELVVGGVFLFKIFYGFGLAGVPYIIASELFPPYLLAGGNGLVLAACSLSHFVVGATFQSLKFYLKDYVFLVFVGSNLAVAAVNFVFIPETKGKSIEEIERMFATKKTSKPHA